ncbi:amino acid adenylation domain-containing protein [Nonomuraea sp. KM90]|uniref:amino acid adenylation domain-containing protein n=1 Tax=Nonomuraea sp. KM90 TaxID=3457428 RepID=UPI003FCDB2B2
MTVTFPAAPRSVGPALAAEPDDVLGRFRRAVAAHPDRRAVRAPDGELSFAGLATRVARVAGALRAAGVVRGSRVGVCLPRSTELPAALLAVWWLGAAYVPLDPAHPAERLALTVADAGVSAVYTDRPEPGWSVPTATAPPRDDPEPTAPPASLVEREPAGPPAPAGEHPAVRTPAQVGGHDVAYVLHTSGSTGRPKGVAVSRGGVSALLASLEQAGIYPPDPATVGWNASISFDASVQQLIRVCRGDTIVLLGEDVRADPPALAAYVREHDVTELDLTPSHWAALRDDLLPGRPLRLLMGGEPVPAGMWRDLAATPGWRTVNLYGPSECTVDATAAPVHGPHPHIGGPLPGVRVYVLDGRLRPAEDGELFVAGTGVAHGYVNRPSLTAERFLPDVVAGDGSRMYRTGDRARWDADGNLIFLGRLDRQVKVRGHRIEPGEVEAVLGERPEVSRCVVVPRGDALAAYYTGTEAPGAQLREHLARRLPGSMVPAAFTWLPEFPRTVGGKLDLDALPVPAAGAGTGPPAEGPVEELIARVWAGVLGVDSVLADDDFFALGGHSLVALKVVARVREHFGVVLPTKDVYRHPRLRDLAAHVARLSGGIS